jgi:hypothetical protein
MQRRNPKARLTLPSESPQGRPTSHYAVSVHLWRLIRGEGISWIPSEDCTAKLLEAMLEVYRLSQERMQEMKRATKKISAKYSSGAYAKLGLANFDRLFKWHRLSRRLVDEHA